MAWHGMAWLFEKSINASPDNPGPFVSYIEPNG